MRQAIDLSYGIEEPIPAEAWSSIDAERCLTSILNKVDISQLNSDRPSFLEIIGAMDPFMSPELRKKLRIAAPEAARLLDEDDERRGIE